MEEGPRPVGEKLVNRWMVILIAVISLVSGLLALGSFAYIYKSTGDIVLARSMAFVVLGFDTLIYVFSVRTLMIPFWKSNMFANKWLNIAVILGFFLQVLPFMNPTLRSFFGVTSLSNMYWIGAIASSVIMFIIVEIFKVTYHSRTVRSSPLPL